MRYVGRITEWNDDRGFGFVIPNGGGDRAFVHISAFDRAQGRPTINALISYEPIKDERRGSLNATAIRHVMTKPKVTAAGRPWSKKPVIAIFLIGLLLGWWFGKVPALIVLAYFMMSGLTIIVYGIDKHAARHNRWRTSESTLHCLALLCGWPGALLAQDLLRHKSKKAEFQGRFWLTVIVNLAALAWLIGNGEAAVIQQMIFGTTSGAG